MHESQGSVDNNSADGSSDVAVAALVTAIEGSVLDGTLDSRCAASLICRLKGEAAHIVESGYSTPAGRSEMERAFGAVEAALLRHDAHRFVATYAALRAGDAFSHIGVQLPGAKSGWQAE
ncbi:hypothetical protein E1N52_41310 [Paraburkholderia guartelaensis]|uniref:Uncharacterized protein n=1 Tax=Paraburkholderia guartelaensis TaxID=2546446 RepID=A0A4R5L2Y1_9BURK|nr:hypothetical protein [Paraburkholderia guartelaensis]TDG02132.1 hypothetical protein E1N52_41310 [Paraburkholderia guartelaensis]